VATEPPSRQDGMIHAGKQTAASGRLRAAAVYLEVALALPSNPANTPDQAGVSSTPSSGFSSATLGTALKHAQTRTKSCPDTRGGAPLRLGLDDNPAASGAFRLPLNPRSDDLHRW
jgi:hypothetical protein